MTTTEDAIGVLKTSRGVNQPAVLSREQVTAILDEIARLRVENYNLREEKDSEERWANHYHKETERLQAELDKLKGKL